MARAEEALQALTEQVQDLQQQVTEQQHIIRQQQLDMVQQQAEVAALRAQLEETARATEIATVEPAAIRSRVARRTTSRRQLLTTAGAAAAAAAAAALVEPGHVAQAATGNDWVLGQSNDAADTTQLTNSISTTPGTLLFVRNFTSTSIALESVGGAGGIGVSGIADSSGSTGVSGISDVGIGVFGGTNNGIAVQGQTSNSATNAFAVFGEAFGSSSIGVYGTCDSGYGVIGQSGTGIDLYAFGTGRILQVPQGSVGAPTSGLHFLGEQVRDGDGELWLCTVSGTPGTWVKGAHALAGLTGGVTNYLSKPIRLLDTRTGAFDALHNGGGPYAGGSTHSLVIAGASFNGVTVPGTALGAIGNVTVVNAAGGGYLALVPHSAGFTGTAILAFSAGQTVSNSFNVGLSSGELDIIIGSNSTDVILDLFAVVA
jgi:hypothetical protein